MVGRALVRHQEPLPKNEDQAGSLIFVYNPHFFAHRDGRGGHRSDMPGVVRKTSGGGCSVKPRPVRYDKSLLSSLAAKMR